MEAGGGFFELCGTVAEARSILGRLPLPGDKLGDVDLHDWAQAQRAGRARLSAAQAAALEAIPDWSWEPAPAAVMVALVREFQRERGRLPLPGERYRGARLGNWAQTQRCAHRRAALGRASGAPPGVPLVSAAQARELAAIPGWHMDDWAEHFALLVEFDGERGRLPRPAEKHRGLSLGGWAKTQRCDHASGRLEPARARALESVPGWAWDTESWDELLDLLRQFERTEGRLPVRGETYRGARLGRWAHQQCARRAAGALTPAEEALLCAVPGWAWVRPEWPAKYDMLVSYIRHRGGLPPARSVYQGVPLGTWVYRQRQTRHTMSPERRALLEAIPAWTWEAGRVTWREYCQHLRCFVLERGRLPHHRERYQGHNLGAWAYTQRTGGRRGAPIPSARMRILEQVPGWHWGKWDLNYRSLVAFQRAHQRLPGVGPGEDCSALGGWVHAQRASPDALGPNQRAALEAVPGWTWATEAEMQREIFEQVAEYMQARRPRQKPDPPEASGAGPAPELSAEQAAGLEALPTTPWLRWA